MNCDFCFTAKMGLDRQLGAARDRRPIAAAAAGTPRQSVHEHPCSWAWANRCTTWKTCSRPSYFYARLRRRHARAADYSQHERTAPRHQDNAQQERSTVRLALSVNGSHAAGRRRVMPVEKAYPIAEILDYLRGRDVGNHHHLPCLNTCSWAAKTTGTRMRTRVVKLLDGVPGRINLIPFNAHPGSAYQRPTTNRCTGFTRSCGSPGATVRPAQPGPGDVWPRAGNPTPRGHPGAEEAAA